MELNSDLTYKFINKPNLSFDYLILNMVYMPMMDSGAFSLYSYLFAELNSSFIIYNEKKINELLKMLKISSANFELQRKTLEALNLMKTYLDESKNTIYFEIFEPLKFESFLSNKKLSSILLDLVGQRELDKLKLIFQDVKPAATYANISSNLEDLFDVNKMKFEYSFDFDEIYKRISKATSLNVFFSEESKKLIDKYYLSNELSINEIEKCLDDSILKDDASSSLYVCVDLLDINLSTLLSSYKNMNILSKVKINRNKSIFLEKSSISDLNAIFNDYKRFNSEQYLSFITKSNITQEEKNTINKLRTDFSMLDFLINIMIDYSLDKTYCQLNEKYLVKVAKSFNVESISSVEEAYEYLSSLSTKNKNRSLVKKNIPILKENYKKNENEKISFIDDEIVEIKW